MLVLVMACWIDLFCIYIFELTSQNLMMTVSAFFSQSNASVYVASIMSHTKMETIADPTAQIPWQDVWPTIRNIVHMTTAHPNVANCALQKKVD